MRNTSFTHYMTAGSGLLTHPNHFRMMRIIYLLHERTYRKNKNYINVNLCDVMELQ